MKATLILTLCVTASAAAATELDVIAASDDTLGLSAEELEEIPPHLRSSPWDSIEGLWNKGQSVIDDAKCSQLPSVKDCCKNSCPICVGGKLLTVLNSAGKFADVFSAANVNQKQIAAGAICGMPETYCKQLTKYFDSIPSWVVKMLSWVVTVPRYYKGGECPDGVLSNILIGAGGLTGAVLMTYLI